MSVSRDRVLYIGAHEVSRQEAVPGLRACSRLRGKTRQRRRRGVPVAAPSPRLARGRGPLPAETPPRTSSPSVGRTIRRRARAATRRFSSPLRDRDRCPAAGSPGANVRLEDHLLHARRDARPRVLHDDADLSRRHRCPRGHQLAHEGQGCDARGAISVTPFTGAQRCTRASCNGTPLYEQESRRARASSRPVTSGTRFERIPWSASSTRVPRRMRPCGPWRKLAPPRAAGGRPTSSVLLL